MPASLNLAIGTETNGTLPHLARLPCFEITRSVVAKADHPILKLKKLTLKDIAAYPIIIYGARHSGRQKVMDAFRKAGIKPKISLSAIDADICKTYVELGLGIAILADITVDPVRDTGIRARGAGNLFESSMVYLTVRPASYVRPYVIDFLQIVAPTLTASVIREANAEFARADRRTSVGGRDGAGELHYDISGILVSQLTPLSAHSSRLNCSPEHQTEEAALWLGHVRRAIASMMPN